MPRIGVIGVGGMGSTHCQALKSVDGTDFVGVWDISEKAARTAAEKFEVRAFDAVADLLAEIEAVIVATPGFYHVEPVITAASAGVHVMVEKPLASSLEDCDRMIAACKQHGVLLMVGQVLRFYPTHQLGRKLVNEGQIGEVVYIEADYSGAYNAPRERPSSWYGRMGGLLENGIHKSDLINWFGGEPKSVDAEVGSFSGHEDWEDYAVSLIRYGTSIFGILRWGAFMGARGTTDTFIDGSEGSLRLCIGTQTVFRKLRGEQEWTELVPDNHGTDPVIDEDQHFIDSIRDDRPPIIDGHGGRAAVEIVLASYASARRGQRVHLPMG